MGEAIIGVKYKVYDIRCIQKLRVFAGIKKKTYWAFISDKWKRIAKEYYGILKNSGIGVILKSTTVINKNRCSGFNKNGLQCNRLVSGTYCFQHKRNTFLDISVCSTRAKELDQFYTTQNNAILCTQIYNKFININKEEDLIIEPSAGCGAFINSLDKLCNNSFLIDIDPKHKRIKKGNFLNFNQNLDKFKKVHFIGNPPFNIIGKFLKHVFKFADITGFVLPLSFRKESRKKIYPLNFHCIHEHVILNNNFYFNGGTRKVPTIFQIWEKRGYNRAPVITVTSKHIEFVKKNNNPTLAFRRVGSRCGEVSVIVQDKSESTHYFIKLKNCLNIVKFFDIYKKIKFLHNNTVGQKSISQQELLLELKKHGV
jgi:hypothetical protein